MSTKHKKSFFKSTKHLGGVPEGFIPFLLSDQLKYDPLKMHLFIGHSKKQAAVIYQQIKAIHKNIKAFYLPSWDCLPYDRIGPSQDIIEQRINTLISLSEEKKGCILIMDAQSFVQKIPPKTYWHNKKQTYSKGGKYPWDDLINELNAFGYNRCETVYSHADYAVRGHIIDIFLIGEKNPIRVDFFDNEIESIRYFSIDTQVTLKEANQPEHFTLKPAKEICWTQQEIEQFEKNYNNINADIPLSTDELYQSIIHGKTFQGIEHWMSLALNEQFQNIEAYAPNEGYNLYIDANTPHTIEDHIALIKDYYNARITPYVGHVGYRFPEPEMLYNMESIYEKSAFILSPYIKPDEKDYTGRMLINFPERKNNPDFPDDVAQYITKTKQQKNVYLSCSSKGTKERVQAFLKEGQFYDTLPTFIMPGDEGFSTKDFLLLTDRDILGDLHIAKQIKKKSHQRFFQELTELSVGDLVVHKDHGIAKYLGLQSIDILNRPHDCLILEYDQGNKLYLPVENMELISRYGKETALTQLDKLGSSNWKTKKGRAKKRIELIAEYLIETAAKRSNEKGDVFNIPEKSYSNFCKYFPFTETEDQKNAIDDVIHDFASEKLMDRLICGDVGFGKTEVALRAAFLAVSSGKQVAVITPTTLLCRQHSETFIKRFQHENYVIKQLSRLVHSGEAKKIRAGLKNGDVHIVVGTHALLSKNIEFKNLGLIIVDEEQHFGVNQKEVLKTKYPKTHVLTLSATPIPRTLQLSFTNVRDLSLITTPPVDRLPVRTFILNKDENTLKEAILREIHRGGQVFYVCPHIKDQSKIEETLKSIIPYLRFKTVNGRMQGDELEDVIADFCDRKFDLLLATNIIESGIDMPSVNTIIIHNAHLFGLSQLYQLRGRVGRSKIQAFAYFITPQEQYLTEQAQKRLKILQSLDSLGAGFHLASHDMDIRGAGNILGEEQTGHIKEVGVDLYQQLLQESILMLKAKNEGATFEEEWTPQINMGFAVLIPENYIKDLSVRISLYKRLSSLSDIEEIHPFAAELVDRFGKFPLEVRNLLYTTELKLLCKKAHVEKIDVGPKGLLIAFLNNSFPNPDGLIKWLQKKENTARFTIRSDQKIFIPLQKEEFKKRHIICKKFLLTLQELVKEK